MSDELLRYVTSVIGPDYRIDAELGRGGMAVVYRGTDVAMNRPVAIKVLPPDVAFNATVRERFIREARLAAALNHPGVVPVYSAAVTKDLAWFAMRLLDGESLGQRIERSPQMPIDDVRAILAHVADALHFAHLSGVVHRDVKPDNIMIEWGTNQPILTDFGIARAQLGDPSLTKPGEAMGTPAYMSPEQAAGNEADARSDVYALGVVGYRMLTGLLPFTATSIPAMLLKQATAPARPVRATRPDVPEWLETVIATAMEKEPARRYQTAAALRDAIGDISSIRMARVPRPSPVVEPAPTRAGLSPAMTRLVVQLQQRAMGSAALLAVCGVVNYLFSPETLWTLFVAILVALNLLFRALKVLSDGVTLRQLFARQRTLPEASLSLAPAAATEVPGLAADPDYVMTAREADMDVAAIETILRGLSSIRRAMLPDIPLVVRPLFTSLQGLVQEAARFDHERLLEVRGSGIVAGGGTDAVRLRAQLAANDYDQLVEHINEAGSALLALRLDLASFAASGAATGVETVRTATERAGVLLSRLTSSAQAQTRQ
ncbi:MAG: protein kinase [Gemmatimonadetes bacterium]|nr:protein kinase [Gemmatimonadota bacterium]